MLNFEKSLMELSSFSFKELDTGSHMPLPEWMQLQPHGLFGFLNSDVSLPGAFNSSAGNFWDKISEGSGVYDYIIKYCEKPDWTRYPYIKKQPSKEARFQNLEIWTEHIIFPVNTPQLYALR